ncbi:hypothetical protein KDM41_13170 [bacterium]|nr:hypothetical protein [bacterium]
MRRIRFLVLAILFLAAAPGARAQVEAYWIGPPVIEVSEGVGTVVLQVGLSGPGNGSQFVLHNVLESGTAVRPDDYTGGTGSVSWPSGDGTPRDVVLTIVDDAVAEGTETIYVALTNADGPLISPTDNVIQVNILDNDGGATLPHLTFRAGPFDDEAIVPRYCYDDAGQVYNCGTVMEVNLGTDDSGFLRVETTDGQAVTDTVRVDLVAWGAISVFPNSVEIRPGLSDGTVIVTKVGTDGAAAGGVRMMNLHNVAPAGPDDFHSVDIIMEAPEPYTITDCFLCMLWTYVFADEFIPCVGDCSLTVGCGGKSAGASGRPGAKSIAGDLGMLRRYRDEVLASTPGGQDIAALYGEMGAGMIGTFLANPTLVDDFMTARNAWLPALDDLLNGAGAMTVTPTMQSAMTSLLDAVAAVATGDLAGQIADLRVAAGLDALTGLSVAQANQAFVTGGATPVEATSWGDLKAQFR